MTVTDLLSERPRTAALRRVLGDVRDDRWAADLLYLEAWEIEPAPGAAAALRIIQLRRANPELAAEIRAEIKSGRPLTHEERDALQASAAAKPAPRRTIKTRARLI